MKIFFDTEFIEDGKTIELISIGMIREDGSRLYIENSDCDYSRASEWVQQNVLPHLTGPRYPKYHIASAVRNFVGVKPEFWAYYADYDWVALCQLYGTMMDLPEGWPMFCLDIKQWACMLGDPDLPAQQGVTHNALEDAVWCSQVYQFLLRRQVEWNIA